MRKILLSLLFLFALTGVLVNAWWQIGYTPFGTKTYVETLHDLFGYARFIAIPVALFAFLKQHGQPTKTLAWVALMLGLPFIGTIVYLFFGLNMRQDLKFRKKRKEDYHDLTIYQPHLNMAKGAELFDKLEQSRPSIGLARHRQLIATTTGTQPTSAYDYCIYHDGASLYDQLVADINAAKHHIHLEYFHFEDDWLGERIAEALRMAVARGIEVRIIYDAVGSLSTSRMFWRKLQKDGIEVSPFFEVRFRHLANRINYRNHRKIVVVDGEIGYTGGFNVAKEYIEGIQELKEHWRDTHLRLRGAAVNHLQLTFAFDWRFSQNEVIVGDAYFPQNLDYAGTIPIQIASSGPDTKRNNIKFAYFNILTRAERYVYLVTPYFTPDGSVLAAMKTAAMAGVDVRLMLPKKSDSQFVTFASNSYIAELLASQVRVFHYTSGMLHSKVLVADDIITSIGTANLDARSHDLNFEINAMLYDQDIAIEERLQLESDMQVHCIELTLDNWKEAPLPLKLARGFARVFSPLL